MCNAQRAQRIGRLMKAVNVLYSLLIVDRQVDILSCKILDYVQSTKSPMNR